VLRETLEKYTVQNHDDFIDTEKQVFYFDA
jgi:hypothetical protein